MKTKNVVSLLSAACVLLNGAFGWATPPEPEPGAMESSSTLQTGAVSDEARRSAFLATNAFLIRLDKFLAEAVTELWEPTVVYSRARMMCIERKRELRAQRSRPEPIASKEPGERNLSGSPVAHIHSRAVTEAAVTWELAAIEEREKTVEALYNKSRAVQDSAR